MKKWRTLLLAVLLIVLIFGAGGLYEGLKDQVEETLPVESTTPTEAKLAPGFTVFNAAGEEVALSDLRGKPVVVNFWATWCGYCVEEMPLFQAAYEKYGDQIHFMMIDVTDGTQETKEKAEAFLADTGYTFPVYFDLQMNASTVYKVNSMPVTYFIGAQGEAVAWKPGAITEEVLQQGIDLLLEEK